MKFIFLFFALLSLSLCDTTKINKLIAVEDAFVNVKKNILECLSKAENASPELRKYATEVLSTDLKESLNLHRFRDNLSDKEVIRKCRREAFIHDTQRRPIQTLVRNKRFLAK